MKIIKRDNAVINYQVSGTGEITLLFVHGSYNDQTYWKSEVGFFHRDYTVVTLDLPGHGQSGDERKDWSIEGFAEDVIAVIKELDLQNVILVGHSMGASVNLMAATSYQKPIIGFIAIDYFKNAGTPLPAEFQQQVEEIKRKLKTDFRNTNEQYARMALLTEQTAPAISKKIVEAYRNANQSMGIATTPEIFDMYKVEQKLLPQLPFKLYLINVDYKPTNEAALQQYAGNGYEVFHMNGTSHFPMLENPETLNKLLHEAIQEISVSALHGA
jgi:sigma-B regulation protein RsbQ